MTSVLYVPHNAFLSAATAACPVAAAAERTRKNLAAKAGALPLEAAANCHAISRKQLLVPLTLTDARHTQIRLTFYKSGCS